MSASIGKERRKISRKTYQSYMMVFRPKSMLIKALATNKPFRPLFKACKRTMAGFRSINNILKRSVHKVLAQNCRQLMSLYVWSNRR